MRRQVALLLLLPLVGCGGSDASSACTEIGAGDAILFISEADSTFRDVVDGDPVPLIRPIQGGQILLVGARVRSDVACTYRAAGTVNDLTTDVQLGRDERTLELLPQPDGWATPEEGFVPLINVPVCPSGAATGRIDGNPLTLRVVLMTEDDAPVLTLEKAVVPTCSDAGCTADCK
jgi:hypothetical protein